MKRSSFVLLAVLFAAAACCAQTYTESVLYSFPEALAGSGYSNPGNQGPTGLVADSAGNLYGTTFYGGAECATDFPLGCGSIFELAADGTFTTIYNFATSYNGIAALPFPCCLVIDKSGNLYGTTLQWGLNAGPFACNGMGCGTVFKFSTLTHEFSILHEFGRVANDGLNPVGPLTMDSAGNLFGTTYYGGTDYFNGTIFEVTPKGVETIKHNFSDNLAAPLGNLLLDAKGDFYGLVQPDIDDTLFEVTSSGEEVVLNGSLPQNGNFDASGAVVLPQYISRSAAGNFYGAFSASSTYHPPQSSAGLSEVVGSNDALFEYYFPESLATLTGPLLLLDGSVYGTAMQGSIKGDVKKKHFSSLLRGVFFSDIQPLCCGQVS
jgi:uncharacterized repeat protein (TIGR03803 family)